ncbi:hypothetical protein KY328_05135 [Candidatus Woesearchaeota archaeon]|nr:hypothetical protein [Candidatus Woesearchaeota archaeon]MBW3022283.1 hypothetical protein [Candidatus Woesearchaeota archaeon]
MLEKVIAAVKESFKDRPVIIKHLERTLDYLRIISPMADEATEVAAYAHDWERAGRKTELTPYINGKSLSDKETMEKHQKASADKLYNFLKENGASEEFAQKSRSIVALHEVGGFLEADDVKDADSLSYFEVVAEYHLSWVEKGVPKESLREKLDFMFNRISSDVAKEMAEPMYKRAIDLLEAV